MVNKSGIHPTGDMVLVAPLTVEEKTQSGLIISKGQLDREQMTISEGVVIEYGSTAYKSPRFTGVGEMMGNGSLIGFAKYAGLMMTGLDEKTYRLIRADDIICTLDAPTLTPIKARMPLNAEEEAEFDIGN